MAGSTFTTSYDPATDSWSTIANPPTPTFTSPAVFAFNGEVWLIGGYDNWTRRGYPPDQEVQIYNPTTNSWHYGPALNQPRYFSTAAGVMNGRAYLVGRRRPEQQQLSLRLPG